MEAHVRKQTAHSADPNFRADEFVPYFLRHVSERLSESLRKALKPLKYTPNVWRILFALIARERATLGELAHLAIIEQSTLSRLVRRMQKQGLVRLTVARTDRRMIDVRLTAEGRRVFRDILPVAAAQYDWAIRGVSANDLEIFTRTLKQMFRNLHFSPIK